MANSNDRQRARCSFCGRDENEAIVLIPTKDRQSYICANCVSLFS
ncbi:MAG: hypothetical protein IJW61_02315, partial [Clostridia bacterium]|nr:hypothetical protein [Clostridia bacterium]